MKIKVNIQNKFYILLKGEIEKKILEKGPQKTQNNKDQINKNNILLILIEG